MNEIVRLALEEDIGSGDVTTIACVPETRMAAGRFLAREPLTLAGVGLLSEIYQLRGGIDELKILKPDGSTVAEANPTGADEGGVTNKFSEAGTYLLLVEELKPFIDRKYRTKREAEFTGLGGSSLGGLATLTLGLWFPNYFNRLAVMSPSIWWDDCAIYDIVDEVDELKRPPLKIWLDTGTHEPGWERAAGLRDRLVEKGWRLYDDLHYLEVEGADHSEGAWAARIDPVLRFLFSPPPPTSAAIAPARKRRGLFQRALALSNLFSA